MSDITKHKHIVEAFDKELATLDGMINEMGRLCGQLLEKALISMRKQDQELAKEAARTDKKIDKLEQQVEETAIQMVAKRQPMAQDLRQIICAIRISTDLERIGDLGKNIAKRAITISEEDVPKPMRKGLKRMGRLVLEQLHDVLVAYRERDHEKAHDVWEGDEEVDDMYSSIFRELLTYMMEHPQNIGMFTHLLFCIRNLERIGDHTTNIAESVHFMIEGERIIEKRTKTDDTSYLLFGPDDPED